MDQFHRLKLGITARGLKKLINSTVAIVGIGGVGSFAAEAIARSGVGRIILVDPDVIDITNLNRQIHALHSTVGRSKVEVMKERILDINPYCEVIDLQIYYNKENNDELFKYNIDFIVDSIDLITHKLELINACIDTDTKFISSMGTANKNDPTKFMISDIFHTSYDPIAKVLRKELRNAGITHHFPVVYSTEIPKQTNPDNDTKSYTNKEMFPLASNAFVPSSAGLIISSYVIETLLQEHHDSLYEKSKNN